MPRLCGFAFVTMLAAHAAAQGYPPQEAASHMTVPDGFHVNLFASEPEIRQPVCIEFDDRGRMWCVQYLQYPKPAGLKRVSVDRWSRAKYDHVPPPPPQGPKGDNVITIMEDTDGDGHADTYKNFVEGLNLCSGIAFGYGGVFVLQVPYLLFYPDKDRNDVPDGDPEVLLTGFGMEDAHSVANSLTWGPDGWLYGTQGSTVTANIRGIEFQQGIWRYHVEDKRFELFCEGGGNMWGLDFNEVGDCFASTNYGPYVCLHAEQGAYYWKSFGKHGSLHNPYAYGYFEHCTEHDPQGGHVTDGGIVYQGGAYPPEFNGKYIANNLLSHAVYYHDVIPVGSTYETKHAGTLLDSHDLSFAPSDLTTGPDGFLYVADWNDKRTAHPDPEAEWDKNTGRIYRISYGEAKPKEKFDLAALSDKELVRYLDNPNYWFRRRARVLLASRKTKPVCELIRYWQDQNPEHPLEFNWALLSDGCPQEDELRWQLESDSAETRRWAVRLIGETPAMTNWSALEEPLRRMAVQEKDPHVRVQLAIAAKRLPGDLAWPIVFGLASHARDIDDPHLPLLIWWAIEAHAMESPEAAIRNVINPGPRHWDNQLAMDVLIPRLIRRFTADGSDAGDHASVAIIDEAPDTAKMAVLLANVEQGLQDRGQTLPGVTQGSLFASSATNPEPESAVVSNTEAPRVSEELANTLSRLYMEKPEDLLRLRLAVRIGNEAAYAAAKKRAMEGPDRAESIKILARFGKNDCIDPLFDILAKEADAGLRVEALGALKHYAQDGIAERLMGVYAGADAGLQGKLREAMLSKANWARVFLAAVDGGTVDAKSIKAEELRVVASHNDEAINKLVEKYWGKIKAGTPEEKLAEMRRLNNELNFAKGDAEKGKQIFKDTCFKCHTLFGEGGKVGPDLTQANRMDREFLLASIVDPSATVRKEYQQYTVTTKSFEVYTGVFGESAPGTLTIYNVDAKSTVLSQDQVDSMVESDLSMMPEDQLKSMSGDAVRDLFAYLQRDVAAAK